MAASGVLANDTDIDGNTLTAAGDHRPAPRHRDVNADGTITYTPAANYNGPDSFTYTATDGLADSNTATVTITVKPVNDAPVAGNDTPPPTKTHRSTSACSPTTPTSTAPP